MPCPVKTTQSVSLHDKKTFYPRQENAGNQCDYQRFIIHIVDLETVVTSANAAYPIFARRCPVEGGGEWLKFYQPLNSDKSFRFFSVGTKPKDYVNGLHELRAAWSAHNERERALAEASGDGKPYREQKLREAVICSGERDALNCLSMGYRPLWLNSESARLREEDYREIMKYVEVLYNVPDTDETGRRKGIELGMAYLELRTVKLPSWLGTYRDNRGKPRKDLRDFVELRPSRHEFEKLLKVA